VCITFDDGWRDFYRVAAPVLRSLAIPATVYLTTYYVSFNRPVFDPMVSYLLWRAAGRIVQVDGIVQEPVMLDSAGRARVEQAVRQSVRNEHLDARAKDALLERLAARLGIDYGVLLRERILHLMNEDEVRQSAEAGFSIQSHTHRHRVSRDEKLFLKELDDNRDRILALTGAAPEHFCYPGGNYLPEYEELLRCWGARTATTSDPGLARPGDNVYYLARHLDSNTKTHEEFAAWVCGLAAVLPRRVYPPTPGQFLEDWIPVA
jgi:peptidoglycan/xylan/chitin deacetylase (PgdA/CDA1 family)